MSWRWRGLELEERPLGWEMADEEHSLLKKLHTVRAFVPSGSTEVTFGRHFSERQPPHLDGPVPPLTRPAHVDGRTCRTPLPSALPLPFSESILLLC